MLPAILVGWIVGNTLGALAGYKGGWLDRIVLPTSLFVSSIPYYCLAIILLYLFAVELTSHRPAAVTATTNPPH